MAATKKAKLLPSPSQILERSRRDAAERDILRNETPCGRERPDGEGPSCLSPHRGLRGVDRLSGTFQPRLPPAGHSPVDDPSQDHTEPRRPTDSWDIIHSSCFKMKFSRGFLCGNSEPNTGQALTELTSFYVLSAQPHSLLSPERSYPICKVQLTPLSSRPRRCRHTHDLLGGVSLPRIRFSCLGMRSKRTML